MSDVVIIVTSRVLVDVSKASIANNSELASRQRGAVHWNRTNAQTLGGWTNAIMASPIDFKSQMQPALFIQINCCFAKMIAWQASKEGSIELLQWARVHQSELNVSWSMYVWYHFL
jgi:hypothetical protein